ncbi:MAG: hypothetical protein LBB14_03950 [Puniceicoccales bacterium]|jgi:hypothetical protein|nr:hypothetical protein [Puniceicoccales bacterium]
MSFAAGCGKCKILSKPDNFCPRSAARREDGVVEAFQGFFLGMFDLWEGPRDPITLEDKREEVSGGKVVVVFGCLLLICAGILGLIIFCGIPALCTALSVVFSPATLLSLSVFLIAVGIIGLCVKAYHDMPAPEPTGEELAISL